MKKNYYVLRIIDNLNTIKNKEDDCCEDSLTDDAFIAIIESLDLLPYNDRNKKNGKND